MTKRQNGKKVLGVITGLFVFSLLLLHNVMGVQAADSSKDQFVYPANTKGPELVFAELDSERDNCNNTWYWENKVVVEAASIEGCFAFIDEEGQFHPLGAEDLTVVYERSNQNIVAQDTGKTVHRDFKNLDFRYVEIPSRDLGVYTVSYQDYELQVAVSYPDCAFYSGAPKSWDVLIPYDCVYQVDAEKVSTLYVMTSETDWSIFNSENRQSEMLDLDTMQCYATVDGVYGKHNELLDVILKGKIATYEYVGGPIIGYQLVLNPVKDVNVDEVTLVTFYNWRGENAASLPFLCSIKLKYAKQDGIRPEDGKKKLYLDGKFAADYSGLYEDAVEGWCLVDQGIMQTQYNDLYCDANLGWWKIKDGLVDFAFTGLYDSPTYGWWLIGGGNVAFWYNDLWNDPVYGWWKVSGGMVDFGFTGLYESPTCGWWLIGGGNVAFWYNDLWCDPVYGWWKVSGGAVDFGFTGLYESPTCGWWLIGGGSIAFRYNDLWNDPVYGVWKISNGTIDWN